MAPAERDSPSTAGEGTGKINKIELEAERFLFEAHSSRVSGMTPPHDNSKSQPGSGSVKD
jgi:hypothetical protein